MVSKVNDLKPFLQSYKKSLFLTTIKNTFQNLKNRFCFESKI